MKKYEMIRSKQALSRELCDEILFNRTTGVLGVITEDGYPYTVPVNYIYADNKIYFHGSKRGLKVECINNNNKASFCVIDKDDVIAEHLTTHYRSVIVFGNIEMIKEKDKIIDVARKIGLRYLDNPERVDAAINSEINALACFEINIEQITGKQANELI